MQNLNNKSLNLKTMQQGGEPSPEMQGDQVDQIEELLEQIRLEIGRGGKPQEIIVQLLEGGMPPDTVAQIFAKLGIPEDQLGPLMEQAMSAIQSQGQPEEQPQGQPSQEQMMAMQEAAPAQPVMQVGGETPEVVEAEVEVLEPQEDIVTQNGWDYKRIVDPTSGEATYYTKSTNGKKWKDLQNGKNNRALTSIKATVFKDVPIEDWENHAEKALTNFFEEGGELPTAQYGNGGRYGDMASMYGSYNQWESQNDKSFRAPIQSAYMPMNLGARGTAPGFISTLAEGYSRMFGKKDADGDGLMDGSFRDRKAKKNRHKERRAYDKATEFDYKVNVDPNDPNNYKGASATDLYNASSEKDPTALNMNKYNADNVRAKYDSATNKYNVGYMDPKSMSKNKDLHWGKSLTDFTKDYENLSGQDYENVMALSETNLAEAPAGVTPGLDEQGNAVSYLPGYQTDENKKRTQKLMMMNKFGGEKRLRKAQIGNGENDLAEGPAESAEQKAARIKYEQALAILEAEVAAVNQIRGDIANEAKRHGDARSNLKEVGLSNATYNWLDTLHDDDFENDRWACNSASCQIMKNAGVTVPMTQKPFKINGRTYNPGDKMPIISGNDQFKGKVLNQFGFQMEPKGTLPNQGGDLVRGHIYSDNSGRSGAQHSVLVGSNGQLYANSGDVRSGYEPSWFGKGEDEDYWSNDSGVARYVRDIPTFTSNMEAAKAAYEALTPNLQTNLQEGGQSPQGGEQEQLIQQVSQALQEGAKPEEVLKQLVQMGLPEQQAMQIIQVVMQQLQGGQGMPAQSPAQAPPGMAYGGERYSDQLMRAQAGMEINAAQFAAEQDAAQGELSGGAFGSSGPSVDSEVGPGGYGTMEEYNMLMESDPEKAQEWAQWAQQQQASQGSNIIEQVINALSQGTPPEQMLQQLISMGMDNSQAGQIVQQAMTIVKSNMQNQSTSLEDSDPYGDMIKQLEQQKDSLRNQYRTDLKQLDLNQSKKNKKRGGQTDSLELTTQQIAQIMAAGGSVKYV